MSSTIHYMRTAAHPLAPLFRSTTQERILAALFLDVDHDYNMRELAAKIGSPYASVHREVGRLTDAGLVVKRKVGQASVVKPNKDAPAYGPLRDLILVSFGAVPVLAEALTDIRGVQAVALHGSYAARLKGVDGPPPEDVDVIVVGDPDPMTVFAAMRIPTDILGLPVNPTIMTRDEWRKRSPFIDEVRHGIMIPVMGTLEDGDA